MVVKKKSVHALADTIGPHEMRNTCKQHCAWMTASFVQPLSISWFEKETNVKQARESDIRKKTEKKKNWQFTFSNKEKKKKETR